MPIYIKLRLWKLETENFRKKLHLRYLTVSWIRLRDAYLTNLNIRMFEKYFLEISEHGSLWILFK